MDGMLSQDEINALLSGMNSGSGDTSTAEADSASSSDDGFSRLWERGGNCVGLFRREWLCESALQHLFR